MRCRSSRPGKRLRVGGAGEPVEWATLMRRLPAAGMLDAMLLSVEAPPDLAADRPRRWSLFIAIAVHRVALRQMLPCAPHVVTDNLDELPPSRDVSRRTAI